MRLNRSTPKVGNCRLSSQRWRSGATALANVYNRCVAHILSRRGWWCIYLKGTPPITRSNAVRPPSAACSTLRTAPIRHKRFTLLRGARDTSSGTGGGAMACERTFRCNPPSWPAFSALCSRASLPQPDWCEPFRAVVSSCSERRCCRVRRKCRFSRVHLSNLCYSTTRALALALAIIPVYSCGSPRRCAPHAGRAPVLTGARLHSTAHGDKQHGQSRCLRPTRPHCSSFSVAWTNKSSRTRAPAFVRFAFALSTAMSQSSTWVPHLEHTFEAGALRRAALHAAASACI